MKHQPPGPRIPACRCTHGHASHTYGSGTSGLSLGPCKAESCGCPLWAPRWLDRYRSSPAAATAPGQPS